MLHDFYAQVTAVEAKWLTRLILKKLTIAELEPLDVYRSYHPLLPKALRIHDDFSTAVRILRDNPDIEAAELLEIVKPAVGIKVGRQPWFKARTPTHCAKMLQGKNVNVQEKLDGEYCQIHISMDKGAFGTIQIFSKSGKDSTEDRRDLHQAIREALHIGQGACPISSGCILEGELVVYNDKVSSARRQPPSMGWC